MLPRIFTLLLLTTFSLQAAGVVDDKAAAHPPIRVALYDDKGAAGKGVPRVTELLGKTADIKVTKVKGADMPPAC